MEKTTSLVKKLKNKAASYEHLAHLTLIQGEMFGWDHTACAITYNKSIPGAESYLLHEFGHALKNHSGYKSDVGLVKIERDAWEEARIIGKELGISISDDLIESSLDTYRDWLHSRSLCPTCDATGIQSAELKYACASCGATWRVNEARTCGLKRYKY